MYERLTVLGQPFPFLLQKVNNSLLHICLSSLFFNLLKRSLRLRSKDVRYLTKKRQYFVKGLFGFFYIKQYPNNNYHQISFHVTIKVSKHATRRNFIKRTIMNHIRNKNYAQLAI